MGKTYLQQNCVERRNLINDFNNNCKKRCRKECKGERFSSQIVYSRQFGSDDRLIKFWDTDTAQLVGTLAGHRSIVVSLAFWNETLLASGSDDFTVKLWTF